MKKLGWILIIIWILFTILPIYSYSPYKTIEGSYNTWFLFMILHEVLGGDLLYGFGSFIGYILILILGIWLISRKKGITEKEKKEGRGEREK